MKNIIKLIAITALVAVIGFSFTACGNDKDNNGGGSREAKTYTGVANDVTYTLKIEDGGSRAVLTPTQGDKYTLTQNANTKKSTGTVTKVVGGVLTLAPKEDPDDEFTATVSGDGITAMSGTITWDDGTANEAPVTLTPSGGGGGPIIQPSVSYEMVQINAGTFTMGSPSNEPDRVDGETQHQVTLTKGFYMGKYQVTQEQYTAVMGTNPSSYSNSPATGEVQGRRPVEQVSWYDALVFCNKLSMMQGLSPAYRINNSTDPANWGTVPTSNNTTWNAVEIIGTATGYRLPTEAEWEYACRAGTTTAYNTGATISDNTGWYISNSNYRTHEVGKKPANAWGLYDMHGNVSEWCWDLSDWFDYSYYSSGAQTDPMGASSGSARVLRGGSWYDAGTGLRSAKRLWHDPWDLSSDKGIRLVRN
jgi:formylglycine-generating enzyme required for sulfatase activity